jgi:16S rRNA processing protein RimM
MSEQLRYKQIGKVMDAHGIRGDLYCLVFSGDVSWLDQASVLIIGAESKKIERVKAFKKGFIVHIENCNDRNSAEFLKGLPVSVEASLFTSRSGESLYLSEIAGFTVFDQHLGELGIITGFSSNGAQDLLLIDYNNEPVEVPFVADFVTEINHEQKKINMNLPDGLLDINKK